MFSNLYLLQKDVNSKNVVKIAKEVKELSFLNNSQSLHSEDINNIATVLEKIVAVKQKENEVGTS